MNVKSVSVNLSIKGVPEALAERLRRRAARNHRSLQRELMAIVEAAVADPVESAPAAGLRAAESAGPSYLAKPPAVQHPAPGDGLLAELDQIVAGSRWGQAPVLTREQANDRRLSREFEHDARAGRSA